MTRWVWRAAGLVLVLGVAFGMALWLSELAAGRHRLSPGMGPSGGKGPSDSLIQKVMLTAYGGPASLSSVLGRSLGVEEPNWDEVRKAADEMTRLAGSLAKCTPPTGSRESWEAQTAAHLDAVRALAKAAQDRDRTRAQAAHRGLQAACMKCHEAHR
jgi:hypothetical protein